jgi:hypothetical protein
MGDFANATEIIYEREPGEPCWPFWGLLEAATNPSLLPLSFSHSYIRIQDLPDFFDEFRPIGQQALSLLKRRTIGELSVAATEIRAAIARSRVESMDIGIYDLITRPCTDGRSQLNPGQADHLHTEHEVSNLLESWANQWDDPSGLPTRDGLSDLDALRWFGTYNGDKQLWYGLIEPEEYEFYAVLALLTICAAVHLAQPTRAGLPQNPAEPTIWQLKVVGRAAINAMEAIGHAESLKSAQQIRHDNDLKQSKNQAEAVAEALSRETSEKAAKAANKRHAPHTIARAWVTKEWALHSDSYSGNMSAFSRTYVARVKNEFKDLKGDPLIVTEKTIREVWLKKTPAAGK